MGSDAFSAVLHPLQVHLFAKFHMGGTGRPQLLIYLELVCAGSCLNMLRVICDFAC